MQEDAERGGGIQENGQQHSSPQQPLATGKVDHLTGERKIKPDFVLDFSVKMGAVDKKDMINSFVGMRSENYQVALYIFPSARHCCPEWTHISLPTTR